MKSSKKERFSWYLYDWAISAFSATVVTVFIGPYLTTIAENSANAQGMLDILGFSIHPGSYFPFIVSASVLLQVLLLPIIGALADFTKSKKNLLGIFSYLGAFATMGMYFLEGQRYILGGCLFLLANISFGAAMVMYNAFLNDIADEDEKDSVSSTGWAFGYLGGGILLALNLFLFSQAESFGISTGMAVRISLASAGLWWAIFAIFPLIFLKIAPKTKRETQNLFSVGFKQLKNTIIDSKKYPKTLIFLAAYLLYNDGVQSVIALSAQFGQEELGLKMATLTQVILIVQFVAFFGALLFNFIAKKTSTKSALITSLLIWTLAVTYSYMWLYSEFDFYLLGIVIGLVMGGTQALSRSMYSNLIPKGKEAEYFSLYEISERGTSWIGPFAFAITLHFTGSYRYAILSLIFFFIAGLFLLLKFNYKQAIEAVKQKI